MKHYIYIKIHYLESYCEECLIDYEYKDIRFNYYLEFNCDNSIATNFSHHKATSFFLRDHSFFNLYEHFREDEILNVTNEEEYFKNIELEWKGSFI